MKKLSELNIRNLFNLISEKKPKELFEPEFLEIKFAFKPELKNYSLQYIWINEEEYQYFIHEAVLYFGLFNLKDTLNNLLKNIDEYKINSGSTYISFFDIESMMQWINTWNDNPYKVTKLFEITYCTKNCVLYTKYNDSRIFIDYEKLSLFRERMKNFRFDQIIAD